MNLSNEVYEVLSSSITYAKKKKIEYITPEVLLLMMCNNPIFKEAFIESGGSIGPLVDDLKEIVINNKGQKIEGTTFVVFDIETTGFSPRGSKAAGRVCLRCRSRGRDGLRAAVYSLWDGGLPGAASSGAPDSCL